MCWFKCEWKVHSLGDMVSPDVKERFFVLCAWWNIFAVGNAVVSCDDCSSVINDSDCIEDSLMDECWVDFGLFLLCTDIQCAEVSETIVVDCCHGRMCNASVVNLVSGGTIFGIILVDRRLRRAGRTSVNHITRFYLRGFSFLTNF